MNKIFQLKLVIFFNLLKLWAHFISILQIEQGSVVTILDIIRKHWHYLVYYEVMNLTFLL